MNYSKQRAAIMRVMATNDEHPTAVRIYELVKELVPNISLGTVYRNLNVLVDEGLLHRIVCEDGGDRFDYSLLPHAHFVCRNCGEMSDVPLDYLKLRRWIGLDSVGSIDSCALTVYGLCRACMIKKS